MNPPPKLPVGAVLDGTLGDHEGQVVGWIFDKDVAEWTYGLWDGVKNDPSHWSAKFPFARLNASPPQDGNGEDYAGFKTCDECPNDLVCGDVGKCNHAPPPAGAKGEPGIIESAIKGLRQVVDLANLNDETRRIIAHVGNQLVPLLTLERELTEAKQENKGHETRFDLFWKASIRAKKKWRKKTGKDLEWPDSADLMVWLMEQNDLLRADLDSARTWVGQLATIGERLRTQDNRCTSDPMFCVQILVAESGFDERYTESYCWWNAEQCEIVYDESPEGWDEYGEQNGWERFGYKTHWETVMVAFTEAGCQEYLDLNGHNDRRRAHKGKVRIYAEAFRRCPEMIGIRKALMELPTPSSEQEPVTEGGGS